VTKTDVESYQRKLQRLRQRLKGEVDDMIEGAANLAHQNSELSNVPFHPADRDVEGFDEEITLIENESSLLDQVDAALARIEQGTFGKCENCGQSIAEPRLSALPYAALCVECARSQSSETNDDRRRPR
jgi:DnaK suppressor protein